MCVSLSLSLHPHTYAERAPRQAAVAATLHKIKQLTMSTNMQWLRYAHHDNRMCSSVHISIFCRSAELCAHSHGTASNTCTNSNLFIFDLSTQTNHTIVYFVGYFNYEFKKIFILLQWNSDKRLREKFIMNKESGKLFCPSSLSHSKMSARC